MADCSIADEFRRRKRLRGIVGFELDFLGEISFGTSREKALHFGKHAGSGALLVDGASQLCSARNTMCKPGGELFHFSYRVAETGIAREVLRGF